MQIYRAEDGEAFQVNKTLPDIERLGSLERFLHDVTGVEEVAVLAYLSDGRRLRDENLRELAGAVDQSIFVFNKHYLDGELEDVLLKLRVEPLLHPGFENNDFADTDMLANAAIEHYDTIVHVLSTVHVQHEALRIASTSLDLHVLSISDAFESFASNGRRELEKQAHLLQGLDLDLEVISKIRIHPEFLSPSVRKAVETGEKARTLGDYVSNVKMRQVGDACAKTHNELRGRFSVTEQCMARLSSGADEVRSSIVNSGSVDDAELCAKRSQDALERVINIRGHLQELQTDKAEVLAELRKLDVLLRDEVRHIVDLKNKCIELSIRTLRHISHLNNDLVLLPQLLSSLQSDFRAKTNFAHIQRLHNMLYAYGATLVEIVRRKEFSRFFSQRAQTIAEIMAKLSSSERKRRQIYRGEVHGQLPFDAKGMDDNVPTMEMEITSTGNSPAYSIERDDLMLLLSEVNKLEQSHELGNRNGEHHHKPLGETRTALEKLISRMDNLEATFDKMAEKTIFSASRIIQPKKQVPDHTDTEFHELVEELHELQDVKSERERQFNEDRQSLQAEIDRLQSELRNAQDQASHEKEQAKALDNDLRQELARVTADCQEAKRLEMEASGRLMTVISEKEIMSRTLEEVHMRERELESQLSVARDEIEVGRRELGEAHEEKDRRLRTQASEADRVLRDAIAEADGDRAVLEHQCFEMRAVMQETERQLKESKAELDVVYADAAGLREELQRVEHELQSLRNIEASLNSDLRSAQESASEYKTRLAHSELLVKDVLKIATAFRDSHCKAFASAQASLSNSKVANLTDSATLLKPYVEPPPISPDDLAEALRILSEYDFATFNDMIAKVGSTIRKWQKQCKEYRDRAKGKISFRNFAKGDLALFLPTRNSVLKPWAAFNGQRQHLCIYQDVPDDEAYVTPVSFPHYFLQATGHLAEQLKTREWIVARITSITEQIASVRDPNSNPYGLGDGTKFYMLQVEGWTQSSPRQKSLPPKSVEDESADFPAAGVHDSPKETSMSTLESNSKLEAPVPMSRHLGGPRQRTHSAPAPHLSSISRLLAQGTPPIEEVTEATSPSPPRRESHSRPSSPLARPSSSLARPSSPLARPISPLAERSHKPHSSPLASPPHSRPSSPFQHARPPSLEGPSYSQPSPPLNCPEHAQTSPPLLHKLSFVRSVSPSPLAGPSRPQSSSPLAAGHSPVQSSPKSATLALQSASRRSSSSSRPSISTLFSASRHPLTMSSTPAAKAAPTTALTDPSASTAPVAGMSSHRQGDVASSMRSPRAPSPEGSSSEGMSSLLMARRRTTSASGFGSSRSSPLSVPEHIRTRSSQGALASLANSWGFGRRGSTSARQSTGEMPQSSGHYGVESVGASSRRPHKPTASEVLRRSDDILPQERGSR